MSFQESLVIELCSQVQASMFGSASLGALEERLVGIPVAGHKRYLMKSMKKRGSKPEDPLMGLWDRVAAAKKPLLALDYDGTLAPFKVERMEARPAPGILEPLARIVERGRSVAAVVSGRPLSELKALLGTGLASRIVLFGSHGFEKSLGGGREVRPEIPGPAKELLTRAEEEARKAVCELCGDDYEGAGFRVERKPAGVAVHVRGMEEARARALLARVREGWSALLSDDASRAELLEFDGGLELRLKGRDKGTAMEELFGLFPGCDFAVYVGDDRTDEDAFRALEGRGVGVKVGAGSEPTRASVVLPDISAVKDFLERWDELERMETNHEL